MKQILVILTMTVGLLAQSQTELNVLKGVQRMMQENNGRVTFSDLHNDTRFSPEERDFLTRLYETFFEVPGMLKSYHEETGQVPTRKQLGARAGLTPQSIELLLRVMESDPRVPPLFERDASGELSTLKMAAIDGFITARGDSVKISQWEGKKLPSFDLATLDGKRVANADLTGKPSLIYFWFTGCPPCVRIAPILSALDAEYRDKGFMTVGFNADSILGIETKDSTRNAYLEKNKTRYTNAHLTDEVHQAFGNVNVYPTLFFSDGNGIIRKYLLNYQDRDTLEAIIKELM